MMLVMCKLSVRAKTETKRVPGPGPAGRSVAQRPAGRDGACALRIRAWLALGRRRGADGLDPVHGWPADALHGCSDAGLVPGGAEGGNILIYSAGSAIRSLIPSHGKLLSSKAMVVNVAEQADMVASAGVNERLSDACQVLTRSRRAPMPAWASRRGMSLFCADLYFRGVVVVPLRN
jgi:hypothetical protein